MIGVDLGIKNCALYFDILDDYVVYSEDQFSNFENFAQHIADCVADEKVFVDFSWNEIYLPGKRKIQAMKYYLAGAIAQTSEAVFVEPRQIREMLGFPAIVPKKEVHRTAKLMYPNLEYMNPHVIDAFLLIEWGKRYYESN